MPGKRSNKHKVNSRYKFDIFRCTISHTLFGDSYVYVLTKDIEDALKTVPKSSCIQKLTGQIVITNETAKKIVNLSKEKWVKP